MPRSRNQSSQRFVKDSWLGSDNHLFPDLPGLLDDVPPPTLLAACEYLDQFTYTEVLAGISTMKVVNKKVLLGMLNENIFLSR